MEANKTGRPRKDRTLILRVFGGVLLLVGLTAAFMGPIELYCFYLFSSGGQFHYEGFGFGSFMFGNIACQIAGYYLIAALLIPLAYGHLRIHRWARSLSLALLQAWLVLGLPLTIGFLFILFASKDLPQLAGIAISILVLLSYPALPLTLIRFYRSEGVKATFEHSDPKTYGLESLPTPILALVVLFTFYIVALHVPILLNGIYPLLGTWMTGLPGVFLLDIAILSLVGLTWGTLKRRAWAWWGALLYFVWTLLSWTLTLARFAWTDMIEVMDFPPSEVAILQQMPIHGSHLAVLLGLPLLLTLAAILRAKGYFVFSTQVRGSNLSN